MSAPGEWNIVQFILLLVTSLSISDFHRSHYFYYRNGGYALVTELVTLVITCFPAIWISYALSGSTGRGLVGSLRRHIPLMQGAGWIVIFENLLRNLINAMLLSWTLLFLVFAISPPDEMTSCNNIWNSKSCQPRSNADSTTTTTTVATAGVPFGYDINSTYYTGINHPEQEYFAHLLGNNYDHIIHYRDIGSGLNFPLVAVGTLFGVWAVVFALCCVGPSALGLASYVLGPAAIACMLAVIIYGYTAKHMNTDKELIDAFFFDITLNQKPKSSQLLWIVLSVTYALGIFDGSAYLKGKCARRYPRWLLVILTIVGCGLMRVLPTLLVAPYLTSAAATLGYSLNEVVSSGPMSQAMMLMIFEVTGTPVWVRILFYLGILLTGLLFVALIQLTMQDTLVELLPSKVRENRKRKWVAHMIIAAVTCTTCFLLSIVFLTVPGPLVLYILDTGSGHVMLFFILLQLIAVVIAFAKTNSDLAERIVLGIFYCLFGLSFLAAGLFVFLQDPFLEIPYARMVPLPVSRALAWLSALLPLVLGLLVGFVCLVIRCSKKSVSRAVCGVNEAPEATPQTTQNFALLEKS